MLLCLPYSRLDLWLVDVESRRRGRLSGFCGEVVGIRLLYWDSMSGLTYGTGLHEWLGSLEAHSS